MTEITLSFIGGGNASGVQVEPLSANHFRLMDEATLFMFADSDDEIDNFPSYGDVFEANLQPDGAYAFVGITERSQFQKMSLILPREIAESAELAALLKQLTDIGGYWVRYFVGFLIAYIPKDSAFDLGAAIDRIGSDFERRSRTVD